MLDRTLAELRFCGHRVTAVPTQGPLSAAGIAKKCTEEPGADLILAAGGDGTINEILNGMADSSVPFAVLPGGTANVLAVELGIGTDMVRAAERLGSYEPERIALGLLRMGGDVRRFALMAGVGLDAMIVYHINAGMKSALGKGAYWLAGFSQLGRRLAEFDVGVNGREFRVSFALISRVRNYGGDIEIARTASLLDDEFEVVLFEGAHSLPYAKYLAGVLTRRLHTMSGVTIMRARKVELRGPADPRVYIQVDGEYVGKLPAVAEIAPKALTLLVPHTFRESRARLAS